MNDEKWGDVMTLLEERFDIEEKGTTHDDESHAHIEYVIFNGPLGRMKIERVNHPKKVGIKTQYSNRIGSDVAVTNVYSEDEYVHTVKAYAYVDDTDTWKEVTADGLL